MVNPADYKRAAANLSARPDRGGMLGMAARMRDAMASGALRNRGVLGMAQAMRPQQQQQQQQPGMKKGGSIKKMAKGGSTASKRADGCATKGKTKGRFV